VRSRSFGNLIDFFQKKRRETWERLPKIPPLDKVLGTRGRRRKGEPKAGQSAENKLGNESLPKLPVAPQIVLLLIIPFLPVVLYSLFFVSVSLLMLYTLFLFIYVMFLVALVITEVAIRPPWYKPSTPENGLTKKQLPAYWQGIWHNPKYDLDLEFEDVEFRNALGYTLRGWFVPAAANEASTSATSLDTSGIERLPRRRHDIGIVCVHGGGRDRRAFLRHLPLFHHEGYDVLLFDLSEHGISDGTGKGFTFGVREKEDVKAAVGWLREEKKLPRVVVFGTSVGGSAASWPPPRTPPSTPSSPKTPSLVPRTLLCGTSERWWRRTRRLWGRASS